MSVPADNLFADLVPGKDDDKGNTFADLIPRDRGPHAPVTPLDTGVARNLKDAASDVIPHAAGGLAGAYDTVAQLPGMVVGGLASGPAAILHALFPDTMPSGQDALAEGENLFQVHPSGRMGEGEEAASQALSFPFEKGAEAGGEIVSRATDPDAPTNDANFQSRFGITLPKATPATPAQQAKREAVTRSAGELLSNIGMMFAGGKEGAEAAKPHEATIRGGAAAAPAFNEAHAAAVGLDRGSNMFQDLIPVTVDGESHPVTTEEADERVHQPVEVAEAPPAENIELKGTPVQEANAGLDQAIQQRQAENAVQDLNDRVHDDTAVPSTAGIDVQPDTMTRMELAEPPNKGIRENPSTRGIDVEEIPQEQVSGGADEGNATEAAQDQADEQLRARISKPIDQMDQDELKDAVSTDPLTLLPNRRAFEVKDRQQPAAAYSAIDLVGFKNLNDTAGHAAGDQMLQAWGKILRRSGLDAARTGGDEFTVRGESPEQLQGAMEQLKQRVAGTRFTVVGADGKPVEMGLDFRYGIGDTPRLADEAQVRNRDPGRQAATASAGTNLDARPVGDETLPGRQLGGTRTDDERGAVDTEDSAREVVPQTSTSKFSRTPERRSHEASIAHGRGQSLGTLRVALQKGLGMSKVSRLEQAGLLKLHGQADDIPVSEADRSLEAGKIQGYWDGKAMHLAADGIAPGDELPVAIHEAIHKVQEDPKVRDDLRMQFKRLVAQEDPTAMQAVLRIPEDTPEDQRHDEGIAYLAEEVAKTSAAERPTKFSQQVLDLVRRYYNAIRARLYASPFYKAAQRVGVNFDLSPRDIAALGRYELQRSAGGGFMPGGFKPGGEEPHRNPGESQEAYAKRLMGSDKQEIQSAMDEARRQQKVGRANFRAMLAQRARALDTADAAFEDARKAFDKRADEANLAAIDQWETGQRVQDNMARQFFDLMDKAFEQRISRIRELAPDAMQHLIENYFPHIWEDSGKAQKWYQSTVSRAPMEGNKSFMKQRTWGTIKEGMASGLKPVSTNPVDMAIAKLGQMDKFIAFHEFRKDLDDRGWLQTMKAGERVPDGYARINDSAFEKAGGLQGYHAAPELIARDVNRYLEPGLYKYAAWRGIRTFQNVLLSARLGLSAFHAGFTTFDTAVSHSSVALQAALEGDFATAAKMVARHVVSPVLSPIEGSKLFKQFYGKVAADADTAAVLHALEEGGARGRMQSTDYNGSWEKLGRAIRKSSLSGTALHMLPGIMEGSSRWLTHHLVPWQKMAARAMLMKFELDRHAEALGREKGDYSGIVNAMHPDSLRQIAGKVVQDVDDRLGQLAYDNLFMNRILKDVSQATVQSVGWNIGTFRTIVGAAGDVRHVFNPEKLVAPLDREGRLQDRKLARVTGRLSYLIAMNFELAFVGSVAMYLMTGQSPQSLKDMFYPRTGRRNPDGSEERLSFPTYIKDEYALATHPIQTVEHKVHPSISMALELLSNKDFYGTEIHNTDDPWFMQGEQIGKYIVDGFEPYAFENEQHAENAGGGTLDRALPFVGVTPAPSDIDRTDFQQFVAENGSRGYAGFKRTPEEAETSEKKRAAEDALRTGRNPDYTGLSDRQVIQTEKEGETPKPEVQFQRLDIEDKLRAYDMATPDERQQYNLRAHILKGRVIESVRRLPKDEQDAVMKRLREIEAEK